MEVTLGSASEGEPLANLNWSTMKRFKGENWGGWGHWNKFHENWGLLLRISQEWGILGVGSWNELNFQGLGTETNCMRTGPLLRNSQEWGVLGVGINWIFKVWGDPPKQSGRVEFQWCPSQKTVLSPDIRAPRLHLNLRQWSHFGLWRIFGKKF